MACRRVLIAVFAAAAVLANAPAAKAQHASIVGRVVDAETSRPLVDAHVFLASTTIGSVTTRDGRFRLDRVPAGAQRLYVSMLGFTPVRVDTLIRSGGSYRMEIALERTVVEGPEVVVTADRHPAWFRRLRKFERLFLGESPNAARCTLENPEVLSFDTRWWGKLTAEAREPLVITNRALGYRVTYFLEEFESSGGKIRFDGEPLFEPLPAADSAEAARWREARRKAYAGSFRHFMRSLFDGTYREEGFRVHRRYDIDRGLDHGDRFLFDRNRVLDDGASSREATLDFYGYIETVYEPERADPEFLRWQYGRTRGHHGEQRSLIELTDGPTRVDHLGEVLDPYGVTVYGYFAYERIADLVPKEYEP